MSASSFYQLIFLFLVKNFGLWKLDSFENGVPKSTLLVKLGQSCPSSIDLGVYLVSILSCSNDGALVLYAYRRHVIRFSCISAYHIIQCPTPSGRWREVSKTWAWVMTVVVPLGVT